jgi:hypothetical protein
MLMPISTYSFIAKAGQASAHCGGGVDSRAANESVTLAERHAV